MAKITFNDLKKYSDHNSNTWLKSRDEMHIQSLTLHTFCFPSQDSRLLLRNAN